MEDVLPELTGRIIRSAIEVRRRLGPGLLEKTYHACLHRQLTLDGMEVAEQVPVPIEYQGLTLEAGYRADLIVDRAAILELKAVEKLLPVHETQMLTYLKLTGLPVALLLNFNVTRPKLRPYGRRFSVFSALSALSAYQP